MTAQSTDPPMSSPPAYTTQPIPQPQIYNQGIPQQQVIYQQPQQILYQQPTSPQQVVYVQPQQVYEGQPVSLQPAQTSQLIMGPLSPTAVQPIQPVMQPVQYVNLPTQTFIPPVTVPMQLYNPTTETAPETKVNFTKSSEGIETSDPSLNTPVAILDFLCSNADKPSYKIRCWGHHRETYTTVENGQTVTRTRTVTDFSYDMDISQYIVVKGNLDGPMPIIEKYLNSDAKMRVLRMSKTLDWDSSRMIELCVNKIRSLGYSESIDVSFIGSLNNVIIRDPGSLTACCNHSTTKCLTWLTCTCCFYYCFIAVVEETFTVNAKFPMTMPADQIFERIEGQIHK